MQFWYITWMIINYLFYVWFEYTRVEIAKFLPYYKFGPNLENYYLAKKMANVLDVAWSQPWSLFNSCCRYGATYFGCACVFRSPPVLNPGSLNYAKDINPYLPHWGLSWKDLKLLEILPLNARKSSLCCYFALKWYL